FALDVIKCVRAVPKNFFLALWIDEIIDGITINGEFLKIFWTVMDEDRNIIGGP
ncbi:MAG: hypothetical protein IE909_17255, partial [Campylobacterales bacterium]|nr:hypothetical protein [Campylobacterales bacterium]